MKKSTVCKHMGNMPVYLMAVFVFGFVIYKGHIWPLLGALAMAVAGGAWAAYWTNKEEKALETEDEEE